MEIKTIIENIDFSLYSESECCRLFHGRGHAWPGFEFINIDWLPPVVLITIYQETDRASLEQLSDWLSENVAACRSVQLQSRFLREGPVNVLSGEQIDATIAEENGLKFNIELGRVRNTGLFLDIRNGRQWVREHADGAKVLNLFAYTCAFSVAALAGGAGLVVNVDNNKSVLSRGRENHRLNQQDLSKVKFEGVNIFNSWSRMKKYAPYDLLISDPPSFQAGSVDIERDYKKIISRIPQLMNRGADLLLCLNSPDLSAEFLTNLVAEHCPDCRMVEEIKAPPVFREAHQGKGLKVFHFRYQGD